MENTALKIKIVEAIPISHVRLGVFAEVVKHLHKKHHRSMLSEKGGIYMTKLDELIKKLADPRAEYTKEGIAPLFSAPRKAQF